MAIQATAATRAPRGTKILVQAFFEAADGIPELQRGAVVKAALAAIRDQLKDAREKAKVLKAKTKVTIGKASPTRRSKVAAPAPKKPRTVAATGKKASAKPSAKPGRKASVKRAPKATTETATV